MQWVFVVVVLLLLGLLLSWLASRVDRAHTRVEASLSALEAQLARRAAASVDLAASGLLDPASAVVIADAADRTFAEAGGALVTPESGPREQAESDLTKTLGAAFPDAASVQSLRAHAGGGDLLDRLLAACRRVELARRFHNDAVRAVRALRRKPLVRLFRLAGRAPWPETVELDDTVPGGLVRS